MSIHPIIKFLQKNSTLFKIVNLADEMGIHPKTLERAIKDGKINPDHIELIECWWNSFTIKISQTLPLETSDV